jgi:hypothetical protein
MRLGNVIMAPGTIIEAIIILKIKSRPLIECVRRRNQLRRLKEIYKKVFTRQTIIVLANTGKDLDIR